MTLANIEGFSSLKKDTASGGVVNVDSSAYKSYMKSRAIATRNAEIQNDTQTAIHMLESKINSMESDISDIKNLVLQLIQKGN